MIKVHYFNITSLSNNVARAMSDLRQLEIKLTPAGGWYGKNETERKVERDHLLSNTPQYTGVQAITVENNQTLDEIRGKITVLETERRALEWCIRDEMVASRYSFFEDDVSDLFTTDMRSD